jgi:hypothetical protein
LAFCRDQKHGRRQCLRAWVGPQHAQKAKFLNLQFEDRGKIKLTTIFSGNIVELNLKKREFEFCPLLRCSLSRLTLNYSALFTLLSSSCCSLKSLISFFFCSSSSPHHLRLDRPLIEIALPPFRTRPLSFDLCLALFTPRSSLSRQPAIAHAPRPSSLY